MFSTTLELAGLAALVTAAFVGAGIVAGLAALGLALLFLGYVTDDAGVARELARLAGAPKLAVRRVRAKA